MRLIGKQWKKLSDREKLAFLVLIPLLVIAIVDFAWVQPMQRMIKRVGADITQLETENGRLAEQVAKVRQELATSGSVSSLQAKVDALVEEVEAQKRKVRQLTDALIPPERMSEILHDVLRRRGQLRVVSLRNIPAEPLRPVTTETDVQSKEDNTPALVYLHRIELVLRGRYQDVKTYIRDLEDSGHHFIWERLSYEVERYPYAEVRLTLASLSDRPFLMGASSEMGGASNAID